MDFKLKNNFKERCDESTRVLLKYPDRVPIICERTTKLNLNLPYIDKNKYLVTRELTVGQFIYVIRKRINMLPTKALFLFIDNNIPCSSDIFGNLYNKYKNIDGFLYITYSDEDTFG
jgi:GABA(A) receptor-associated protein